MSAKSFAQNELGFGLNYTSFDYQEELTAPSKSTEKGTYPLFYAGLQIPIPNFMDSVFRADSETMFLIQSRGHLNSCAKVSCE
jgi:hypothetical protein